MIEIVVELSDRGKIDSNIPGYFFEGMDSLTTGKALGIAIIKSASGGTAEVGFRADLTFFFQGQLSREVCYGSSDLLDSPGLANLFIQSKRFEAMIDLVLLPYSDSLLDISSDDVETFDKALSVAFGGGLVNAMADGSTGGEYITDTELVELLDVGLIIPSEVDIIEFSSTWNQSLSLWNQGVFTSDDLPSNFSDPFFDIGQAGSLMSAFESARTRVQSENFAGFGDAWLTAVEAQQLEEAKQLAGVCASVRVRIEQELTLTRLGFEARLEISNDGGFPLENVTGKHQFI